MNYQQKWVSARVAGGLFALAMGVMSTGAQAVTVTDIAGRTVTVPDDVQRVVLGEGRLFFAVSLLEGQKPFDRIVGWQEISVSWIRKPMPPIRLNSRKSTTSR